MMNWELEAIPLKIHNLIEMGSSGYQWRAEGKPVMGSSYYSMNTQGWKGGKEPITILCLFSISPPGLYSLCIVGFLRRLVQVSCAWPCSVLYCRFSIPATSFLHIPQCSSYFVIFTSLYQVEDSQMIVCTCIHSLTNTQADCIAWLHSAAVSTDVELHGVLVQNLSVCTQIAAGSYGSSSTGYMRDLSTDFHSV